MENSYRFFQNTQCAYFPCHKVSHPETFNCLFCYCPLYLVQYCGGRFVILPNGVKDCSSCLIPHIPHNYEKITQRLKDEIRDRACKDNQKAERSSLSS